VHFQTPENLNRNYPKNNNNKLDVDAMMMNEYGEVDGMRTGIGN
jgi:hypothetical protein